MKHLFTDFWEIKDKEALESYLIYWCHIVDEAVIQRFIKVANIIGAHWSGIINYIERMITNGILEELNSNIQLAKKRAKDI